MQFIERSPTQHEGELIMLGYSSKKKNKESVAKFNLRQIELSFLSKCYISQLYDNENESNSFTEY